MRNNKFVLIQGTRVATYIGRMQVAILEATAPPDLDIIAELFADESFWNQQ